MLKKHSKNKEQRKKERKYKKKAENALTVCFFFFFIIQNSSTQNPCLQMHTNVCIDKTEQNSKMIPLGVVRVFGESSGQNRLPFYHIKWGGFCLGVIDVIISLTV